LPAAVPQTVSGRRPGSGLPVRFGHRGCSWRDLTPRNGGLLRVICCDAELFGTDGAARRRKGTGGPPRRRGRDIVSVAETAVASRGRHAHRRGPWPNRCLSIHIRCPMLSLSTN